MEVKKIIFTDLSTGMKLTLNQWDIKSIKQSADKDIFYVHTYNGNFTTNYLMWVKE